MAKPKTFDDPAGTDENEDVVTEEELFAGSDQDDQDNDEITGDRGDDPDFIEDETDDKESDADVADAETEDDADPEDESEDEPETEDEADAEAADEDSPYVTKDRFNAVNERMKLAEQQLREDEAARLAAENVVEVEAFDYDKKEMEYMELVNDGEYDKANTVRKEIRSAERAEIQAENAAINAQSGNAVAEQVAFTNKVAELAEEYDTFNPEHESYDQVLVDEAIARRDMFAGRGMSNADALDKAAREVAKLYDIDSKYELMADEEIERMEAEQKPAKKKTDVKKKVAQAKKQPSKMDEGSSSEETKTSLNMNDDEFDALPESTKARMRGDII